MPSTHVIDHQLSIINYALVELMRCRTTRWTFAWSLRHTPTGYHPNPAPYSRIVLSSVEVFSLGYHKVRSGAHQLLYVAFFRFERPIASRAALCLLQGQYNRSWSTQYRSISDTGQQQDCVVTHAQIGHVVVQTRATRHVHAGLRKAVAM